MKHYYSFENKLKPSLSLDDLLNKNNNITEPTLLGYFKYSLYECEHKDHVFAELIFNKNILEVNIFSRYFEEKEENYILIPWDTIKIKMKNTKAIRRFEEANNMEDLCLIILGGFLAEYNKNILMNHDED